MGVYVKGASFWVTIKLQTLEAHCKCDSYSFNFHKSTEEKALCATRKHSYSSPIDALYVTSIGAWLAQRNFSTNLQFSSITGPIHMIFAYPKIFVIFMKYQSAKSVRQKQN